MSIDQTTVLKVAQLARIRMSETDAQRYSGELSNIMGWIEQLQEVDTDGVEPMTGATPMTLPMREDKVTDGKKRDLVLKNAPKEDYGCFVVPKVIE